MTENWMFSRGTLKAHSIKDNKSICGSGSQFESRVTCTIWVTNVPNGNSHFELECPKCKSGVIYDTQFSQFPRKEETANSILAKAFIKGCQTPLKEPEEESEKP